MALENFLEKSTDFRTTSPADEEVKMQAIREKYNKDYANLRKVMEVFSGNPANVICCNDSVEAVHIGYEADAEALLKKLSQEHYKIRSPRIDYKEYCESYFWHIHNVKVHYGKA